LRVTPNGTFLQNGLQNYCFFLEYARKNQKNAQKICSIQKKAVPLQRELSERVEKPSHFYIKDYVERRFKKLD
jgi:hypothetical protein